MTAERSDQETMGLESALADVPARIAAAVAAEREACVQTCLWIHQLHRWQGGFDMKPGAYDCAEAIRARGKTDVTSVLKDGQAE